ncbi:MAG TPA: hypothetical protein VFW77_02290 [Candidatus Saccharimonadales bacterium]|nr:hypothetical protein [Candidatus Saccharimonadales bacterium]
MPPQQTDTAQDDFTYQPEENTIEQKPAVSWTASEFVDHQRGAGWYLVFFAGLILIGVLMFKFTKDYISGVAIIIAGVILAGFARRRPRQLPYEVGVQGISIGGKLYPYEGFKSFGLGQEAGAKVINLVPLQRFMPDLSVFFPPEQEADIIGVLADHLPHNDHPEKAVDKLAKKLRF